VIFISASLLMLLYFITTEWLVPNQLKRTVTC